MKLRPEDFKIETYRSPNQGVHQNPRGIRLIHISTNTMVECSQKPVRVANFESAFSLMWFLWRSKCEMTRREWDGLRRSLRGRV